MARRGKKKFSIRINVLLSFLVVSPVITYLFVFINNYICIHILGGIDKHAFVSKKLIE